MYTFVCVLTSSSLINAVAELECKHAASTWDITWLPRHEHMRLTEREREREREGLLIPLK